MKKLLRIHLELGGSYILSLVVSFSVIFSSIAQGFLIKGTCPQNLAAPGNTLSALASVSGEGVVKTFGTLFGVRDFISQSPQIGVSELKFLMVEGQIYFLSSHLFQYHDEPFWLPFGKKEYGWKNSQDAFEHFKKKGVVDIPGVLHRLDVDTHRVYSQTFKTLVETQKVIAGTLYVPSFTQNESPPWFFEIQYIEKPQAGLVHSVYKELRSILFSDGEYDFKLALIQAFQGQEFEGSDKRDGPRLATRGEFKFHSQPKNTISYSEGVALGVLREVPLGDGLDIILSEESLSLGGNGFIALAPQKQLSHNMLAAKSDRKPVVYLSPSKKEKVSQLIGRPIVLVSGGQNGRTYIKELEPGSLTLYKEIQEQSNSEAPSLSEKSGRKGEGLSRLKSFGLNVPLWFETSDELFQSYQETGKVDSGDLKKMPGFREFQISLKEKNARLIVRSDGDLEDMPGKSSTHGAFESIVADSSLESIVEAIELVFEDALLKSQSGFRVVLQEYIDADFSGVISMDLDGNFTMEVSDRAEGITSDTAERFQSIKGRIDLDKNTNSWDSSGPYFLNPSLIQKTILLLSKALKNLSVIQRDQSDLSFDIEWVLNQGVHSFVQLRENRTREFSLISQPSWLEMFGVPTDLIRKSDLIVHRKPFGSDNFQTVELYLPGSRYDSPITVGVIKDGKVYKYEDIESTSHPFMHHGPWDLNLKLRDEELMSFSETKQQEFDVVILTQQHFLTWKAEAHPFFTFNRGVPALLNDRILRPEFQELMRLPLLLND